MSPIKSAGKKFTLTAALIGASFSVMAADIDMSVDSNDLAIKGYDPVATLRMQAQYKVHLNLRPPIKMPFTSLRAVKTATSFVQIHKRMHLNTAAIVHLA